MKGSWQYPSTEVRNPKSRFRYDPNNINIVLPKPYQLWEPALQRFIFPLTLCFSIAWSLELYAIFISTSLDANVMTLLYFAELPTWKVNLDLFVRSSRNTDCLTYFGMTRALLLALPHQFNVEKSRLVQNFVFQDLGRGLYCCYNLHASGYHLVAIR